MRRQVLLTGGLVAAISLTPTLGCNPDAQVTATIQPAATAAKPPISQPDTSTPGIGALPTTTEGVTVSPNDPAIIASEVTFQYEGVTLIGYLARP